MAMRRPECGFQVAFSLRDSYPTVSSNSVFSTQLRAYMQNICVIL
jgi:hypothetical protein